MFLNLARELADKKHRFALHYNWLERKLKFSAEHNTCQTDDKVNISKDFNYPWLGKIPIRYRSSYTVVKQLL